MTAPLGPLTPGAKDAAGDSRYEKLHHTAQQLVGLFVRHLYSAMRETVPDEGLFSSGSGGETFQQLFDEAIADRTPEQWNHGLAAAVARQFTHTTAAGGIPPAAVVPRSDSPR